MHIVAKALISNPAGDILVLIRSNTHPLYPEHPDFPGGEVEAEESGIDGVVREILEETGLLLQAKDLSLLISRPIGNSKTYETYTATVSDIAPSIQLSWEHSSYSWISRADLLQQTMPDGVDDYYKMVIDDLRSRQNEA